MHSVPRSAEPDFLADFRAAKSQWDDMDGPERQRIRTELIRDFGEVCAYCEQLCYRPSRARKPNDESIEHFRPLSLFPELWLDWLNLIYACRMCNQNKGGKWPGSRDNYDEVSNRILSSEDSRYSPAPGYINPSQTAGQRAAQGFFDFDTNTGRIAPSERLTTDEWSMARRMIWDLDLDSNYLRNLRMEQLDWLLERLNTVDDFDEKVNMMFRFMLPKIPFSTFIRAYVTSRFPLINQFLQ